MSAEANYAKQIIAELEEIEFETGSDIRRYTERVRRLSRALAMELEYSAQELEAVLKDLPPGDGESHRAVRSKSRSIARHLRRSAEAQRTVGIEAVRTWGSMVKHFEHLIKPKKRKKTINLEA
ncbi:hypothetical protein BJF83_12080 [Nocardiopsis sp. CNR-923]|uniref:hypothetical protein n=1 Tax=Nocardiopsis sp. CNR-923 TaxID=1904965 RepID=UPI00095AF8CF|nr:hypothetical protein [Nocardiopsis sp. CNR-923]OLT29316.1 hypothetical protein BJF83_12080 [Nocardiopsis sp. CNR-923]